MDSQNQWNWSATCKLPVTQEHPITTQGLPAAEDLPVTIEELPVEGKELLMDKDELPGALEELQQYLIATWYR